MYTDFQAQEPTDEPIRPRKTTDIDMVLVPQELSAGFVGTFWKFIKEGGYKFASRKNSGSDRRHQGYPVISQALPFPDPIRQQRLADAVMATCRKDGVILIDTVTGYRSQSQDYSTIIFAR